MKKWLLSLAVVFGGLSIGMLSPDKVDAAIKVKDGETVTVDKEDNAEAIALLEKQGFDFENSRFDKSQFTMEKPDPSKVERVGVTNNYVNPLKDKYGIPGLKLKAYNIDAYWTGAALISNPYTGSVSYDDGIRCNELAPLWTSDDNAIAASHVFPISSQFYFDGGYVAETGGHAWDGGYYWSQFYTVSTDFQWYRYFWASVQDENDLLN